MNRDFAEMLDALSAAEADYLIVGAHALAAHGRPRATGDLDIWIRPAVINAERVWRALVRSSGVHCAVRNRVLARDIGIQRDCRSDQRLERGLVDLLVLVNIDRAPCAAGEARVEELRWILHLRVFGERQLDDLLVGLARANQPVCVTRPGRPTSIPRRLRDPPI